MHWPRRPTSPARRHQCDELGHATETYNKTLRAVGPPLFCAGALRPFGGAAKSEQLFEGGLRLDGRLRAVAVLECAWQNVDAATKSLEPCGALGDLESFL